MRTSVIALSSLVMLLGSGAAGQTGVLTTVAGNGTAGYSGDGGAATSASLKAPSDVVVTASGNLYIADTGNSCVRRVSPTGVIETVAGNGTRGFSGDGGPATAAALNLGSFTRLAADSSGNLYIADTRNQRIRKVAADGTISTIAGNGRSGYSEDGEQATTVALNLGDFSGLAVDGFGTLYIADSLNGRVRKVTADGVITTVAGQLSQPIGLALDGEGNLYIADSNSGRVRKVSAGGVITTVAGSGCYSPSANNGPLFAPCVIGDGGSATSASMYPTAVGTDVGGNLYIGDGGNSRVRKVVAGGTISTVAGGGTNTAEEGAAASAVTIGAPTGVALDSSGNLYFADRSNNRIRKVSGIGSTTTPPPVISAGGIVPIGSTTGIIQPGAWVSIYGSYLGASVVEWKGDFPTSLGGTSVTINGKPAYLSLVSPRQINLQAPDDTATGSVAVKVTTASGSVTGSVTLAAVAPAFFLLDSKHVAAIIPRLYGLGAHGGGTYDIVGPTGTALGYATTAARPGDTVVVFAGGLGSTSPAVPAGRAYSGAAPTTNEVKLLVRGESVTPSFAGLSGVGLYQINFIVPSGLGTGDVSFAATVGGVRTPSGPVLSLAAALPPPRVQSLTLSPPAIYSGGRSTGTVRLSSPMLTGDAVVALRASNSLASVPVTVTVPVGAISATFPIAVGTVASNQSVSISASYGGGSAQATLVVGPASNPQCTNLSGAWFLSETGTMTMTIALPSGPITGTDPLRGSGSTTITQKDCSIEFPPVGISGLTGNLTASQAASLVRTGSVSGNSVTVSGVLAILDRTAAGQLGLKVTSVDTNLMTATGSVSGDTMTLDATGKLVATGTYTGSGPSGPFTLTITSSSTATFRWSSGTRPAQEVVPESATSTAVSVELQAARDAGDAVPAHLLEAVRKVVILPGAAIR